MIRYVFQIIGLISLYCLLAPEPSAAHDPHQSASNVTLEEIDLGLSGGQTLKEWYEHEDQSSNNGDNTYFGAYVTLPVGNDLYIGLASARPAENIGGDGAYFASFDGANLTGVAEPDEQGLHEMIYDGSLVHIAGTDPHNGDNWDSGNHYTYSPGGSFTKYRDGNGLIYVIHTWGLWDAGSTLYAAVSAHDGTYPPVCDYGVTCMGQIFSSPDDGATWTHKSDLGGYRAYDIIGFDGDLYAIHNDALEGVLSMSKSTDGGDSWSAVAGLDSNVRRVHMVEFNSQLLAVSFDRSSLYAIDASDNVTTHSLPTSYLVGATYAEPAYTDYKIMTVVNDYLYLIAENQSPTEQAIIRTDDLNNWERMVHTNNTLISLSYWPNEEWLVTATPGTDASLWRVDLSGTPTAITLRSIEALNLVPVWFTISIGGLLLIFFAIIRKFVQFRFS